METEEDARPSQLLRDGHKTESIPNVPSAEPRV